MPIDSSGDIHHLQQALADAERRAARATLIGRIGRLINSSLSLDSILQAAIESINELLNYPSIAVLMIEPDDPHALVLRARSGEYARRALGEYRQSIDDGIIGAAVRARRTLLISDVRTDPRYIPIPGADDLVSELAVPIVAGDDLLGVLNLESKRRITGDDADSMDIMAEQLGIAIYNARRYADERQRTERLALIARVGQRIAARLDPDELFEATVGDLRDRLGYDHVSLFLIDALDPAWLVQRARASRWPRGEAAGYRQSIQDGVLGAAARGRAPVLVNDVETDPRYIVVPNADGLRAELAMPILLGDRLFGVLDVAGARRFGEEDTTAIQIIADQLAVAIDNAQLFAQTHRALTEMRLLYETSTRISAAADVDDVIRRYLEQVAARGAYACSVALYEFDAAGERRAVLVHGRWTAHGGIESLNLRIPYTRDALDPPLDAGQTVAIADVHADERVSPVLRDIQARDGRPALAMIPLMARDRRIGLVVLSAPRVRQWGEVDLQPYQATAAQLATAIDGRRQQLIVYERGRQIAVLEERQRLARELHDSVTQLIFSTMLIAQSIAPAWQRGQAEGEKRVQRLLELSQAALTEMRTLLFELRPADSPLSVPLKVGREERGGLLERVRRDGLASALKQHAADLARDGLIIDVETDGYASPARPPASHEEAMFRIAQEALNNVVKHASARRVRIALSSQADRVRLCVADDGVGFAGEAGRGMGMQTMRERAEALGGSLCVTSEQDRGTTVEVILPGET